MPFTEGKVSARGERESREGRREEGSDIRPIGLSEGGDGFAGGVGRVIMTAHCLGCDRYRVAKILCDLHVHFIQLIELEVPLKFA